ncbi:ABC transporter permease [Sulfitobacter sp. F26204]|uniref:ABC transporter permease n=1 Tax=Sulfitobacter sp. F26204 TaxID=2996014 RepID=UPI00225DF872|nr:ABC transporter permease [Sulfitobacter sp. F26204]MCX7561245.1 ABC transporter permease [Sulfitobacter sp. F26204]
MTTRIIAISVLLFLPLPIVIVVLSSFTSAGYLSFPIKGLSLRWYGEFLGSADWLRVLGTSALLAFIGATVSTAASFAAAWAVVRHRIRFGATYETILLTPLIFPHAAIGVIMIVTLSSVGWLGTFTGLVLVHCILTIPYAYRPVAAALRKADPALEEAAASLGARPWRTFWQVSLPAVRPGLVTSLLFSFIISFDEVTVTMFLVGPFVMTLPVQVFSEVLESASPVIAAVSATLVLFTTVMVFLLDRVIGIQFFVERD